MNSSRIKNGEKGFCSWSGGKDCCLALYKALRDGREVSRLLTMTGEESDKTVRAPHGLNRKIFDLQAEAMEIPIYRQSVTWDSYERKFKEAVRELMDEESLSFGVFGDSELQGHRDWVENTSSELGIEPILPLWHVDPVKIYSQFIEAGFQAIVINAGAEHFNQEVLGRRLDYDFLDFLSEEGIHPTGEGGEYHTLVIDGPLFERRIEITEKRELITEDRFVMDVKDCKLR